MRRNPLATFAVAVGLCAVIAGAYAATTVGSLEPTTGTWRAYRGTGYATLVCSNSSEAALLACVAADAESRKTSTRYQLRYPNRYVSVTYSAPPPVTANRAPTISGTPAGTGQVGVVYRFKPTAADADGDALTFTILHRPRWATFNTATGELVGTPTADDVAFHSDIAITVSDGRASVALPDFAIAVKAATTPTTPADPPPLTGTGSATLSWTPPTQYTDGSSVGGLAGYRIAYGTSATELTGAIQIADPSVTRYDISKLLPGKYFFTVRAYTSDGTESAQSAVVSKVIL